MQEWAKWFYKGDRWLKRRSKYLETIGGLCERCSTDDDPILATIVHHKIYLTQENINDDAIAYGFDNLEGLCQACHNKEHHGTHDEGPRPLLFDADGQPHPK